MEKTEKTSGAELGAGAGAGGARGPRGAAVLPGFRRPRVGVGGDFFLSRGKF